MNRIKFIFITSVFNVALLFSYQPSAETRFSSYRLNFLTYELKEDGNFSKVVLIDSINEFVRFIVDNPRPVVLRVFSDIENKPDDMKNIFHSVADELGGRIFFAAVNVDNNKGFVSFFKTLFLFDLKQLPLVLFFIKRQIVLPVLSGQRSKEHLLLEIKERFGIEF